jgi:hypothetical protein
LLSHKFQSQSLNLSHLKQRIFTMKPFFSSPVPKFSKWMTVCALGVTLLGLPATVVAQEASVITSAGSAVSKRHSKIYVHHTQWLVEYAENGRNGDYHAVPWLFLPDGTVRSGNLWRGVWQIKSNDTISVTIRMNDSSATDQFDVKFNSRSEFTAFKNGHAYRYGVRR